MNPTRILPDLQASLLCEDIRQEVNGNFLIVGIVGVIRVPQIPITALKLCVFNRWTAGIGGFHETVRLIAPDMTTVVRQSQVNFALQDPAHHATNVSVFGQVEFTSAGLFFVEVLVDDVMKIRFPVPVILVTPPQPNASAKPPQGPPPPASPPA